MDVYVFCPGAVPGAAGNVGSADCVQGFRPRVETGVPG